MNDRNSGVAERSGGESKLLEIPAVHTVLTTLIDRLDSGGLSEADVIRWGSPILSFGDLAHSRVATLGINPSNREFVNDAGMELQGSERRFHTLYSLGLESWAEADSRHIRLILNTCSSYFHTNPYDAWFKRLDLVVSATNASFYNASNSASHLDLIPYATTCKWTELTTKKRHSLLAAASDTFGLLLRDSPVEILILNGSSVVREFQEVTGVVLEREEMPSWSLPRRSRDDVMGVAYWGAFNTFAGIELDRDIRVLGFNHNLQSSFGVTTRVVHAIRDWIGRTSEDLAW